MIKQVFNVRHYWKVIVLYDLDYTFLYDIVRLFSSEKFPKRYVRQVLLEMYNNAKAATCSNIKRRLSIVMFNPHYSKSDYLNSIVHEAEHVKQAMLYTYAVEDFGEPPAYTIGYLISRMYEVFQHLICDCR